MNKLFVLAALISSINCILLIRRVSYDPETEYAKVNISIFNDWKQSSIVNVTALYLKTVLKMRVIARVMMPMDENDQEYRRMFYQTILDINHIMNDAVNGSFMIRAFMEHFAKSIVTNAPRFPIPAGHITRIENFTITDKYMPPLAPVSRGAVFTRFLSKVPGKKGFAHSLTIKFYGEYRRP